MQDRVLRTDALGSPLPQELVLGNGPELTSEARFLWSEQAGGRLLIDRGKPALVESFNARFRDTCLNEQWFTSLAEAHG